GVEITLGQSLRRAQRATEPPLDDEPRQERRGRRSDRQRDEESGAVHRPGIERDRQRGGHGEVREQEGDRGQQTQAAEESRHLPSVRARSPAVDLPKVLAASGEGPLSDGPGEAAGPRLRASPARLVAPSPAAILPAVPTPQPARIALLAQEGAPFAR